MKQNKNAKIIFEKKRTNRKCSLFLDLKLPLRCIYKKTGRREICM